MAYCDASDVQAEFKGITFGAATSVTDTKVLEFITQADAFINAKISLIYSTPVVAGDGLEVLKEVSIKLVAHRIKRILEVKTGATQVDQGGVGDYRAEALAMLKEIVDRKMLLAGASFLTTEGGIDSFSYENGEVYTFKKSEDQW